MSKDGGTLIEKVKARRTYADRPVSDSDHSDPSPDNTTEKQEESRPETPTHDKQPASDNVLTKKTMDTGNGTGKTYGAMSTGIPAAAEDIFNHNIDEKSTKADARGINVAKECCEDECFQTMVAEALSDSEEENDKVHTCIDFADIKFKGPMGKEKPHMKQEREIQENIAELPCDIFFLNEKTTLQRFKTYDELSEYLVNASVRGKDENETNEILKNLVRIPLKNAEHFITMGQYLKYLYEDEHLIDVVLDIQGKIFFAHRVALCCNSDYFADFFSSAKGNKTPFELKIKGVTANAFAAFLEFCYTGEITVSPGIAADILIMADFLKVTRLKERCDIVAKDLPLDQSLKMVVRSKAQSTSKLFRTIFKTVLSDFRAASMLEPFLNMDIELFCQMLESDDLVVTTEFDVFTVAIRWIVHDLERRVKHTIRIMSLIRFYYMSQLELFMCVETTSLVRGYDKFREMVLIANWLKTADRLNREDPFKFPKPKPRNCFLKQTNQATDASEPTCNHGDDTTLLMPPPLMTSTPKAQYMSPAEEKKPPECFDIFVVGGFVANEIKEESKYVDRYDVEDNQWLHFSGLPAPRRHHAAVVLDNDLYLIGGSEPYNKDIIPVPTNTVFRMSLESKKWSPVSEMNVYRHSHCACVIKGHIYVIGGKGKYDSILLSVECYDPKTNVWVFVPSLPEPLFGASAAALGCRIFVTGGIGANKNIPSSLHVLNTVYSYNTITTSWTKLRDLRFPRCLATLVNVDDKLFLCGGATRSYDVKNSVLCSVSAMDEYDLPGDEWFHVADMVIPRHDAGAAVAGSRIYIIGGISTPADRVLQSIECYDTMTFTWISGIQDLPYPARWICCCSVPSRWHRN